MIIEKEKKRKHKIDFFSSLSIISYAKILLLFFVYFGVYFFLHVIWYRVSRNRFDVQFFFLSRPGSI